MAPGALVVAITFFMLINVCSVSERKNTFYFRNLRNFAADIVTAMRLRKIFRILTNRYVIATVIFLLVILFFDQFNLKTQLSLHRELKEQEAEIQHLESGIALYKDSLRMVTEDREGMERIAREKYFMKRDNEVVYKIEKEE